MEKIDKKRTATIYTVILVIAVAGISYLSLNYQTFALYFMGILVASILLIAFWKAIYNLLD